ncbi:Carboxylesterase NlhH [Planctomycetales bacterium 10988]|nr:Carboxylesterase NlhH [Planctomycetales bacterium 10988]
MPLDPQAQALLAQQAAQKVPSPAEMTPEKARKLIAASIIALDAGDEVAKVEDRTFMGPAGPVPIRIYKPHARAPYAAMVYFHGGGWVVGSLETHDAVCRSLANQGKIMIIAVDYRLAPEHRFPAAVEDAYAATEWVLENTDQLNINPKQVMVGGDSAGGNLAAAVTLMYAHRGRSPLAMQFLAYPICDYNFETPSYEAYADGYNLTRGMMKWYWDHYLPTPQQAKHPFVSVLQAEKLDGVPPALILTAEYDPLRDEAEAYAEKLKAAGIPVTLKRYNGLLHGFLRQTKQIDRARHALVDIADVLQQQIGA